MAEASDNRAQADDVVIARIVKARGIRGEVACGIETDFPERFQTLDRVTVLMPDGQRLAPRPDRDAHDARVEPRGRRHGGDVQAFP
ncbi:MAG TPA: hypothetical protein VLR90_13365, partial [Blastocatellia bacterium]|nr:hypothetical protein [Blastocatellia bacterium]